jgi:hypothetical protein
MDETLDLKHVTDVIDAIADDRIRNVVKYAVFAAMASLSTKENAVLHYKHLAYFMDGGKPGEFG